MKKTKSVTKKMTTKKTNVTTQYMTVTQAAKFLKLSNTTVYRMLTAKKIPATKIGRLWRFTPTVLTKWVASGKAA